jgi:hypothetical protein
MKRYILCSSICLYLLFYCTGCVSYSTLQSAKTLDPGNVLIGGGAAFPASDNEVGSMFEFNGRVGIAKKFDVGAKYSFPSLFFLDAKYQILDEPITLSADLGWSYFSYSGSSGESEGTSTAWYPMLIAGQDHWYVAVKEVYFMTEGEFEFFGSNTFNGSGWLSTNIVAGGIIGTDFRVLPELNLIIPGSGKTLIVPAVGLQFVFD